MLLVKKIKFFSKSIVHNVLYFVRQLLATCAFPFYADHPLYHILSKINYYYYRQIYLKHDKFVLNR